MAEYSLFTKIIKGEIPCHKVYEDDSTLAFLDIHPIQPGQVLIVSKKQIENFFELPQPDYAAFMDTVKKVARKLHEQFPAKRRIAVIIEGLEVAHGHAKVFPIDSADELRTIPDSAVEPDHDALAALAQTLYIG